MLGGTSVENVENEEQKDGSGETDQSDSQLAAPDAPPPDPKSILEAMLFVGHPENEPLTSGEVASLVRGVSPAETDELIRELNADYDAHDAPYHIVSEGAGYRLMLREEFDRVRLKFHGRIREARLSQCAIEVLSIVAYNQPITVDEVNRLRNAQSGGFLTQLVRRQILRIERPPEKPRRPLYHTTDRFLHLFRLTSLDELPQTTQIETH